ncbi:MAG: threonine aldolase family protein [Acidimicrobiia bacterium]
MIDLAAEYVTPADPVAIEAVARVAAEAHHGYGADPVTERVRARLRELVGECDVQLVTNGSAANVVALAAAVRPYDSIICTEYAHIAVDEAGDVERFTGAKLLPIVVAPGRLTPDHVAAAVEFDNRPHRSRPRVVSITNATERGDVYSAGEVQAIAEVAHAHDVFLHMDGARLANAAAALDVDVRALTRDAGVDVLTFGFTKNGGLFGDAVVSFVPGLFDDADYVVKQAMQLVSRGALLAASIDALLEGDRWLANARHANRMARRLADSVRDVVHLAGEPKINQVFARFDPAVVPKLLEAAYFYEWPGEPGLVRWVTSHATTEAEVDSFASMVRSLA